VNPSGPDSPEARALADSVVVVTGGGGGIGEALARRLATHQPAAVAVVDRDGDAAAACAAQLAGVGSAWCADLGSEQAVTDVVRDIEAELGPIDVWWSNAGVLAPGGVELPTTDWQRSWDVNVMAHVWAARLIVPAMVARGGGRFAITASAAGVLAQIGAAPYSVTKHAAVALAEWLSITYGDDGLLVCVLCPQAVATAMTAEITDGGVAGLDGMLTPDEVAAVAVDGMLAGEFMLLPHPEVATYAQRRVTDKQRWLAGMRRLQARFGTPPAT